LSISFYSGFTARSTGYIVTATEWNAEFQNFVSYVNNTLVTPLSTVSSNKGSLLTGDGTNLQILTSSATNGQVLTVNTSAAYGIQWAALAATTALTTQGDLLSYTGSALARLGVGTNGQILTANSAAANGLGINWATPAAAATVPSGGIIAYNPSYGGNTIPTGWTLCDGNNSTPNLIGNFILGGQLTGGSSSPASGGYGNQAPNTQVGNTIVSISVGISGNTGAASGSSTTVNAGAQAAVPLTSHYHSISASGSGASTFQPASYVLVYIQKN
jgi:hypothetical protein